MADNEKIEIWMEGCDREDIAFECALLGCYVAKTFDEAVEMLKEEGEHKVEKCNGFFYIWGCRLFDNENSARRGF